MSMSAKAMNPNSNETAKKYFCIPTMEQKSVSDKLKKEKKPKANLKEWQLIKNSEKETEKSDNMFQETDNPSTPIKTDNLAQNFMDHSPSEVTQVELPKNLENTSKSQEKKKTVPFYLRSCLPTTEEMDYFFPLHTLFKDFALEEKKNKKNNRYFGK